MKHKKVRLTSQQAKLLGLQVKPKIKGQGNPKYYLNSEKLNQYNELINKSETYQNEENYSDNLIETDAFKQYCTDEGLDISRVKSAKYVNHQGQQKFNIVFDYDDKDIRGLYSLKDEFLEKMVSKYITKPKVKIKPISADASKGLLQIIISDVHVGMQVNGNGFSLYGGKWDKEELFKRRDRILEVANNYSGYFDECHVLDLGDIVDGWNGETARKGHHLPQNMDNETMYDVAVEFKISLVSALSEKFSKVELHSVSNDNHGGSFSYITNSGVTKLINAMFDNVKAFNYRRFISHYSWNNYNIILTHGKDDKHLKFGFKPQLDPKGKATIEQYMREYNLFGNKTIFYKGDSHQCLFDYATSDYFDYINAPSLAPSSDWVQTNFQLGRSGFLITEIMPDIDIVRTFPVWIK